MAPHPFQLLQDVGVLQRFTKPFSSLKKHSEGTSRRSTKESDEQISPS